MELVERQIQPTELVEGSEIGWDFVNKGVVSEGQSDEAPAERGKFSP